MKKNPIIAPLISIKFSMDTFAKKMPMQRPTTKIVNISYGIVTMLFVLLYAKLNIPKNRFL